MMKKSLPYILLITAVLYAGISCQKELSGDPVGNAAGTLDTGIDGGCLPMGVYGKYIPNASLTNLNYIEAPVTITKAGAYVIYTDTINGFSFKANGSFSTTGSYKIKLNAAGKPLNAGQFNFYIKFVNSSCTTIIDVADTLTGNNDFFPLTFNSYWIYDDLLSPGDTIKKIVTDSVLLGGVFYKKMVAQLKTGEQNQNFYCKTGNEYFEFTQVDKYTAATTFVPALNAPVLFLKENLSTGDSWKSNEYLGIDSAAGKPIMLQYIFICTNADANVPINGVVYQHAYNITMDAQTRFDASLPYSSTKEINNFYYVRGIGLMYEKKTNKYYNRSEIIIKNWQVR